ncbi:DJ-1/PfpI family protein [Klebsiella pneumoniae]|uniref:DJ-1/PfpI family protein n=1 Tax=Klebsiella pneumoniae TaxID=573 RepID=UPI003A7FEB51
MICHAPWLLVSAGMVGGRTLTSFPSLEQDIRAAGGHWVDEPVQVDDNWVTSRTPDDLPAFNAAFLSALARRTKGSVKGTADDVSSAAATGG